MTISGKDPMRGNIRRLPFRRQIHFGGKDEKIISIDRRLVNERGDAVL